jgi:hypothetical protein
MQIGNARTFGGNTDGCKMKKLRKRLVQMKTCTLPATRPGIATTAVQKDTLGMNVKTGA